MIDMNSIRQLRAFVVLAEELHFGRAANRLNIVQPALSMTLKALEEELGAPLLVRNRKGVALTKAGEIFRGDAIAILQRLDLAVDRVHQVSEGKLGLLHLAGSATALASGIAAPFIRHFTNRYPQVSIKVSEIHPFEQARALREGEIDIAFASKQFSQDTHDQFEGMKLVGFPYLLAVSHEHPLAREQTTSIKCLAGETLIALQTENIHGDIQPIFGTLPQEPSHYLFASSALTMLSLVDANLGVAVVSSALRKNARQGISFIPLEDVKDEMEVWMFSRAGSEEPLVRHFLSIVKEVGPSAVENTI